VAGDAGDLRLPVYGGPVVAQNIQRPLRGEAHPDGFDEVQGGLVNLLHVVGAEHLEAQVRGVNRQNALGHI
jgi:hypothetical protein